MTASRGQHRRAAAAYKEQGDGANPDLYYCKWDFCGRLCSSERGVCCRSYSRASRPAPHGCGHRRADGWERGAGRGLGGTGTRSGTRCSPTALEVTWMELWEVPPLGLALAGCYDIIPDQPEITTASPPLLPSPRLNGFFSLQHHHFLFPPLPSSQSLCVQEAAVCLWPQLEPLKREKQQRPHFFFCTVVAAVVTTHSDAVAVRSATRSFAG